MFLAFKEHITAMVSAYNDYAKVESVVMSVDIQYVFFMDAWHTDRSPCLSVLHGRIGIDVVEQHCNVSYNES
jgi:hypothetical protein